MTNKPTEHRSSANQPTWLWMIATVAVIGGFMYWLAATSEPSTPTVVEATDDQTETTTAPAVPLDQLATGLTNYLGMEVRLEAISVASRLGSQAFWTATSKGIPFLVRLAPSLAADSVTVAGGETVTVVGRVVAMSDSVLTVWQQEGVIAESQRVEAEFATGFLEATQLEKRAAPAGAAGAPQPEA